jgi:hypothetical protein
MPRAPTTCAPCVASLDRDIHPPNPGPLQVPSALARKVGEMRTAAPCPYLLLAYQFIRVPTRKQPVYAGKAIGLPPPNRSENARFRPADRPDPTHRRTSSLAPHPKGSILGPLVAARCHAIRNAPRPHGRSPRREERPTSRETLERRQDRPVRDRAKKAGRCHRERTTPSVCSLSFFVQRATDKPAYTAPARS